MPGVDIESGKYNFYCAAGTSVWLAVKFSILALLIKGVKQYLIQIGRFRVTYSDFKIVVLNLLTI